MEASSKNISFLITLIRERKLFDILRLYPKHLKVIRDYRRFADSINNMSTSNFMITSKGYCVSHLMNQKILTDTAGKIRKGERKLLFYSDDNQRKDIKNKWESERLHELVPYVLSVDKAEAEAFILDSVDKVSQEIFNETNSMEVAISAINVIEACKMLADTDILKNVIVCGYLKKCLVYILNHPEKGKIYSNNHYFFNLIGLLWILNHCSEIKIEGLHDFVFGEFSSLLNEIVSLDGSLYEGTTFYHRYVTESLLEYIYLNGEKDKVINETAKRMVQFSLEVSDNGHMFGFGDNDSGRILPIPEYFGYSSRDICLIKVLAENLFSYKYTKEDICYKDYFGVAIKKSGEYALAFRIDEGKDKKRNKYIGGHAHNDLLSVEISFYGQQTVINRGTYLYIADFECRKNNLLTRNNSTVCFDELEQNSISNDWIYKERKNLCSNVMISDSAMSAKFSYEDGISHRRKISFTEDCIEIEDIVQLTEKHGTTILFFLDSEVQAEYVSGKVELLINGHKINISSNSKILLEDCYIYPEYGLKVASKLLRIVAKTSSILTKFKLENRKKKEKA